MAKHFKRSGSNNRIGQIRTSPGAHYDNIDCVHFNNAESFLEGNTGLNPVLYFQTFQIHT